METRGVKDVFASLLFMSQIHQIDNFNAYKKPPVCYSIEPEKLENCDYLYLKQKLAPQVCFQRVTCGSIVFVTKHL